MKARVCKGLAPLMPGEKREMDLADEVFYGMEIEILEKGDWSKVRTFYRYEGYLREEDYILEENLPEIWRRKSTVIVVKSYADVQSQPSVQGYQLVSVPRGAELVLTGEQDGHWLQVVTVHGENGWIYEDCVAQKRKASSEEELRDRVVIQAEKYLGTQYRWGGKSILGIDCSGLVFMSYLMEGVLIYRDADIVPGFPIKEIEEKDAKKGDLIFFPGHVAMYLGEGKYIHSTAASNGVVYNSLNPRDENYREDLSRQITKWGSVF